MAMIRELLDLDTTDEINLHDYWVETLCQEYFDINLI